MALTYGNVPMFGYEDRQFVTAGKPEGVGWNNLGRRDILGVVLHRMLGTLTGTDQWFGYNAVEALTDYGIGVAATDGAKAGHIYKWNDPLGHRSGWASGPVSTPYGDGAAFVAKYGILGVNKRLVSMEISGQQNTPMDDFSWRELVHFIAWHADQKRIPYDQFPHYHVTGFSFLLWHQEFTIGTGKECPFTYVMQNTNRLIADVKAMLQECQMAGSSKQEPGEQPPAVPTPKYAIPLPIAELTAIDVRDKDTAQTVALANGYTYVYVGDRVRCTQRTARYQRIVKPGERWADIPRVGPDIEPGETFDVTWLAIAPEGHRVYITPYWTRVMQGHTERVKD